MQNNTFNQYFREIYIKKISFWLRVLPEALKLRFKQVHRRYLNNIKLKFPFRFFIFKDGNSCLTFLIVINNCFVRKFKNLTYLVVSYVYVYKRRDLFVCPMDCKILRWLSRCFFLYKSLLNCNLIAFITSTIKTLFI